MALPRPLSCTVLLQAFGFFAVLTVFCLLAAPLYPRGLFVLRLSSLHAAFCNKVKIASLGMGILIHNKDSAY